MTSYGSCITDAEVTRGEAKGLSENKLIIAGLGININYLILLKQGNGIKMVTTHSYYQHLVFPNVYKCRKTE